jgi:plasmid stabilization system protein ParE
MLIHLLDFPGTKSRQTHAGGLALLNPTFTPQANFDFAESLNWYVERDVAAAERFQSVIESTDEELRHNPDRWLKSDELHRECKVKGFPFSIFYRTRDNSLIIAAIVHHSRKSDHWRKG